MRDAIVNGRLVVAGPGSPEKAMCPSCGGAVSRRKRRKMDGEVVYFYRHNRGVGEACARLVYP